MTTNKENGKNFAGDNKQSVQKDSGNGKAADIDSVPTAATPEGQVDSATGGNGGGHSKKTNGNKTHKKHKK